MQRFNLHTARAAALSLLVLAGSLTGLSARAAEPAAMAGDVQLVAPWVRATPPGMAMAAGYVTLVNIGDTTESLVGARATFAERVELHRTEVVDDVATMRQLEKPLAIEPGATVALEPGGLHIMFIGVSEPLAAGDSVMLTLQFARHGELDVEFPVQAMPGMTMNHGDMQHGDMQQDMTQQHDMTGDMQHDMSQQKDQSMQHDMTGGMQKQHQSN